MVEVSIEVSSGAARFHVAVQAESIQRATNLVAARYPGRVCRLKFSIDPMGFFVNDAAAARSKVVGLQRSTVMAT